VNLPLPGDDSRPSASARARELTRAKGATRLCVGAVTIDGVCLSEELLFVECLIERSSLRMLCLNRAEFI